MSINYYITIQRLCEDEQIPKSQTLRRWTRAVLQRYLSAAEINIRLVEEVEMIYLNTTYRQKKGSTNVLAFPADIPEMIPLERRILGDVVICPFVLNQEALSQNKTIESHWAHLVIHGCLHLLGYDHIKDDEAAIMQQQEVLLMHQLGYGNPYEQ